MKKVQTMVNRRGFRSRFIAIMLLLAGVGIAGLFYARQSHPGVSVQKPIVAGEAGEAVVETGPSAQKDKHNVWTDQREPATESTSTCGLVVVEESMNKPEDTMNTNGVSRDHETVENKMRRVAASARAMEDYLKGKDPEEVSVTWIRAHFGEPHSQTSTSLVYEYDTGLGGNKWEFQLEGGKVKRVVHQGLD